MREAVNQTPVGSLKISEDVLKILAAEAVREVAGVHSLEKARATAKDLFIRGKNTEPIHVSRETDAVQMDISVVLKTGYKICEVAEQVQQNVKNAVQTMTGIAVSKVNIYVAGISA
ncbi:MAG TPA: Asp23/Gls24 family envelope stress response protein [Firmicutes bacterium]|nr:Asp23/Gls24 family envelope stress response protein [Bacillota bacterium]